jgi:hypothetical protein
LQVIQRFDNLVSSNVFDVGTTAIQVSGGAVALTGVTSTFIPSRARQAYTITNNHASQTVYIGSTDAVTATDGWFKKLAPGEFFERLSNGGAPVWLIASGAATTVTMEEWG